MTITVREIERGSTWSTHGVTATGNMDETADIPHGLGQDPQVILTQFGRSMVDPEWVVSDSGPEIVEVTKLTRGGTGSPDEGLVVYSFLLPDKQR